MLQLHMENFTCLLHTKGKGYMTPFSKDMITNNTKTLTLTPFVSTDIVKDNRHIRGELIPAGEAFTIELQ